MKRALIAGLAALSITMLTVGGATARTDAGQAKGPCSAGSEWELRLTDRGRTFRVRWDVDSGVVGEQWSMSVSQNGTTIASGMRTTNAAGEAEFRLRGVPDNTGPDTFSGLATNPATGETCSATSTV